MAYIKPGDVHSPKAHWKIVDVIIDEGPGQPAYAIGTWDGERRVGFRWNGTDESPIGNPQSRGLPTWTILDPKMHPAVIALAPEDKQTLTSSYLGSPRKIELVVDWHPSQRWTLKEREEGKGMYRDLDGDLFANNDKASFYRAVAKELNDRQQGGQTVLFKDTQAT